MKTNNSSTKSTPSTTPTQAHPKELEFKRKVKTEGFQNFKAFDEFIQSSLDKFKFVDPMQELYDATGNDANTIISHKSTIPDLVIWNKTFDKNECFEGAECNNNNPFPRFQFYLRVKTNKTNEKTEKKKKDKKVNTKDELSRKESNQDIPTVSLLSTTTTTTENGKANKDIKDKRKDNKNKMNNTNKKTENKNDKTNKLGDNTNNTVNNSNTNKIKPPRTLKDLLDGENTNKPNVTTVDTKQIFNDNNNNNINNNSINSNSLSNSPFDDIEQDNKMFGQVLTNKNELTTNTNVNMNVQQSSNDINNGNSNNNNNNNQNRNNILNQQSNKNFFEQDFNFNNILGDDIKPSKTNQQESNTFDFDIPHLKDDDNEMPSPSAMKVQSHLQNMNTFMDTSEKELQHQQQSYFNNEFNNMNTNTNVNTPPQNILNQLKDNNNNNNIMQDNNSQRNEYENMFFKMSNPSPQPQLPPSQMNNPMHRNINPPSNTMNPMFDIQNNSNPSMQFHMQEQLEQQQMQQQQQQQQLQHHGNNFLQNMANLNINEQKLKKKTKKPKQQQQPHQFPNPNINNFDNDIHPFQQPSPFPMQNQPHLQQTAFPHEQNSFLQNINSHPNQYQQQLLLQQQQQQQQQQQRQQTEYLLNIVATNFDRKGWSLLGEGGRMFEAFTSYELFQFLKEKINMLDISMLAIADRDKRLMLRGDQMFYILSHTLPIIIQYKQKQLAMFGLQNQNAMNVNPNMGIPPMSNTFPPQIQGMQMQNMNMNVGMNMNMNINAGMNMNMNMASQKKQRKNKK